MMQVAFFVEQFPVRSQTFVLNQITGLLDLGINVSIISLHKGDVSLFGEDDWLAYRLITRCHFLLEKHNSKPATFIYRLRVLVQALITRPWRLSVWLGLHRRNGRQAVNLVLSAIAARQMINDSPANRLSFDWILCHFGNTGVMANKLRSIGVFSGKIATVFHGYDLSIGRVVSRTQHDYQTLFKQTELVLPISHYWYERLIDWGCTSEKLRIHRMGVNLSHFTGDCNQVASLETKPSNKSHVTIFTVARFTEKKGLCYAIESLCHLPKTWSVTYVIAGYGELAQALKRQVTALGLTDKVVFPGQCSTAQVISYMKKADMVLQPSVTAKNGDMEGVPVTLMEAMALEVPVIATIHSGIPELITDNVHGLLVPEKDAVAIARCVVNLVEQPNLAKRLTNAARKQVESIANVAQLNQQLLLLLNNFPND